MPKELETREVLKRLSSEGWILRSGKGEPCRRDERNKHGHRFDGSTRVGDRDA